MSCDKALQLETDAIFEKMGIDKEEYAQRLEALKTAQEKVADKEEKYRQLNEWEARQYYPRQRNANDKANRSAAFRNRVKARRRRKRSR